MPAQGPQSASSGAVAPIVAGSRAPVSLEASLLEARVQLPQKFAALAAAAAAASVGSGPVVAPVPVPSVASAKVGSRSTGWGTATFFAEQGAKAREEVAEVQCGGGAGTHGG